MTQQEKYAVSRRTRGGKNARAVAPVFYAAVRGGTRRRIEKTFYGLFIVLLLLALNLVRLQAVGNSDGGKLSVATQIRTREILPRRGDILAADGTAIAVTLDEYTVAANPRALSLADREKLAALLAKTIGGDSREYSQQLQKTTKANGRPNYYVRLARHVEAERADKLKKLMRVPKDLKRAEKMAYRQFWSAVSLEPTPRRNYPMGEFATQLLGFANEHGAGDGLEWAWDKELAGKPGEIVSQVDARERPVPGFVKAMQPATPGMSVVTTIDPEIQADTDAALREACAKYKPNFITAIVMRPRTGEIVAMSTAPAFDLNKRPKNVAELLTNRAVNFAYEPGSTFKIITASAVVENVPDWSARSFFVSGTQQVGHHLIHNWNYSKSSRTVGQETLSSAIRDSSNITVYNFARLIGRQKMNDYARRFGIGEKIDLAGLRGQPGWIAPDAKNWGEAQFANFSFGQGMLLTPLQLIRAGAAIANDGVMMKPLLVRALRDERGRTVRTFSPQEDRRVIQPETARAVTAMMERVTSEGTARKYVFVPGYKTAGKTGSAQKAVGKHGYAAGKFISSFIGFVPAGKPEFIILVVADEPHGSHWGSEVCGPPFAEIANKAMLRLRLRDGANAPAPSPQLMTQPRLAKEH